MFLLLFVTLGYGLLDLDDYIKVAIKRNLNNTKQKLIGQIQT
ncbi:hypothetical protein ACEQPO_12250 [Bacillus sp. SL00103]